MKGLFKGFRYISHIFEIGEDDEKEEEIQIGLPTDVKHVAHIGSDAPSVEPPSWMKEFKQGQEASAALDPSAAVSGGADDPRVCEDSNKRGKKERNGGRSSNRSSSRDIRVADAPIRSSRRTNQQQQQDTTTSSSNSSSNDQQASKKDATTRSRKSRRNPSRDMSSPSDPATTKAVVASDSPSRAADIGARKTTTTNTHRRRPRDAAATVRSRSKPASAGASAPSADSDFN